MNHISQPTPWVAKSGRLSPCRIGLISIAVCFAHFLACSKPNSPGLMVALLVDKSISVDNDQSLYRTETSKAMAALTEGDRFIIAPITASSGTDFRRMKEFVLPDSIGKMGWMDEPLAFKRKKEGHEKELQEIRSSLRAAVDELLSAPPISGKTAIFESLRTIAPIFAGEAKRRKILILLSDMVEDSEVADFEGRILTPRFDESELTRQRNAGILPDLRDISIYVGGILASPPDRAAALEQFWTAYFNATGASLKPGRYARVLNQFPQ